MFFQIRSIGIQMNTGKNNLLITIFGKTSCLRHNVGEPSASDSPSCIRNNAIRTELIASVLNLHKSTGVTCRMAQCQFFIRMLSCQVMYMQRIVLLFPVFQNGRQIHFFIISNENIHRSIFQELLPR